MGHYNGAVQLEAAAAIELHQVCKLAAGKATPVTAGTETICGVAADTSAALGAQVSLTIEGQCDALVNGTGTAIAFGDELMCGASGRLVKYVSAAGNVKVARALDSSSVIKAMRVLLYNPQPVQPA